MFYKRILRSSILRTPLLFLYHKYKNRHLVKFWWGSKMSMRCKFEGMNMIRPGVSYYGNMGLGSYIGNNTHLNADIGRFTSIAPGVRCINATHPMKEPFATTSPLFFSLDRSKTPKKETFAKKQMVEEFRYFDKEREIDVCIGNDCWIGADVTIIGGTRIHDGAVVLANAWVTKDVPPYAIVGGTPAKVIDYRYDEKTIKFLQETKWWDNEIEWFQENWELLCDMQKLKEYYKKKKQT